MSALRIGVYTSSLAQSHRKPPGVDVFVDRLAERLARRGHRVVMLTYSEPDGSRSYELRSLTPTATATSRLRRMFAAPARLNTLEFDGLDVLHLHGDDWFYVRRPIPTVRTFHGSALHEARHATRTRRRVGQGVTFAFELLAARLATQSYTVQPEDQRLFGPGTGHLPLAVDLPPNPVYERPGPPTIVFVGTWSGRKRGALLHDRFTREVRARVPDARLVMVSDMSEPGPGVEWLARPTDSELTELYRQASVFCLPSSYEGFGLPYLEAMAQGTPVVATSNPGARFVLEDGRHGVVTDECELGRRLAELLTDEPVRLAVAQAGRARAEVFGWDGLLDQHERAYRQAITRFAAARGGRVPSQA